MTYLDFNSGTVGDPIPGFALVPYGGGACAFKYTAGGKCGFVSTNNLGQAIYTAGSSTGDASVQITQTIQYTDTGNWQSTALILSSNAAGTSNYQISFDMTVAGGRIVIYVAPTYTVPSGAVSGSLGLTLTSGSQYTFRASRTGNTIDVWLWPAGSAQPSTPTFTFTDPTPIAVGYSGFAYFQLGGGGVGTSTGDDAFFGVPSDTFAPSVTYTAGIASASAVGNVTATITATSPSGGTATYGYQWERKTGAGGIYANVSGATGLTLNDTGLTQGTTYLYRLKQTDSSVTPQTVYTNEVTVATCDSVIVLLGNSQTVGIDGAIPYSTYLAANLNSNWYIVNRGVSGRTTPEITANLSTTTIPLLLAGNVLNVVWIQEVMNQIYYNATGAQAWASLVACCAAVRGLNRTFVGVVLPQPDRNDFPNSSTIPGTPAQQRLFYQTEYAAFMAMFLPNWRSICDGYIDLSQDPRSAIISNATYYNTDGVHWKSPLESIVAEKISATLPMVINPRNRVQYVA